MHHALKIPEIQHIIFTFVFDDSLPRVKKRNLVSLAVTSQVFKHVALDIIWYTLGNVVPLIKCLPEDLYYEKQGIDSFSTELLFIRPLQLADLERFDFYASKIRRLNYVPCAWLRNPTSGTIPDDLRLLDRVWRLRPHQPIFPNLRWLRMGNLGEYTKKHGFTMFVGDQLIGIYSDWDATEVFGDVSLDPLVDALLSASPPLEILDLGDAQTLSTKTSEGLSVLISTLSTLRVLSCGRRDLSEAALTSIARFPYLHSLQLPNQISDLHKAVNGLGKSDIQLFPGLQRLDIRASSLVPLSHFLRHVRPQDLSSLIVHCEGSDIPAQAGQFFSSLEDRCPQHVLKVLKLTQSWDGKKAQTVDGTPVISSLALEPIFAYKNLTCLEITLLCRFSLDDTFLRKLSLAFPQLQQLELGSVFGWGTRSATITLQGLLPLVENCPSLEKLGLTLDATDPPDLDTLQIPHPNYRLTYLHVGSLLLWPESPDPMFNHEAPATAGMFLSKIFPKLSGIGGTWLYWQTNPIQQVFWEKVTSSLVRTG